LTVLKTGKPKTPAGYSFPLGQRSSASYASLAHRRADSGAYKLMSLSQARIHAFSCPTAWCAPRGRGAFYFHHLDKDLIMPKTIVKVVADSDTHKIRFEYSDDHGKQVANFFNGLLSKEADRQEAAKQVATEADRFEELSKSVQDRELSNYYASRAREARG